MLTGESVFVGHFTHRGYGKAEAALAAPYPDTVLPVDLSQTQQHSLTAQKDSLLCTGSGIKVNIQLNRRLGSGLVGKDYFSQHSQAPGRFGCNLCLSANW